MFIIRDNTGQLRHIKSLEEAAQIVELDPHEIAWALEEYGRCETDTHCVVVDNENQLSAKSARAEQRVLQD